MKKSMNPFHKPTDREAVHLAYKGKAKVNHLIGDKEGYIDKNREVAKDYISNGLVEEAKPIAQGIAKAEDDKKRLLRKRAVYDRVIARAEGSSADINLGDVDGQLATWANNQKDMEQYGDRFGDVIEGLNNKEGYISEVDEQLDQIQGEHRSYSDRAEDIIGELQIEVNSRKGKAAKMQEEADAEPAKEKI